MCSNHGTCQVLELPVLSPAEARNKSSRKKSAAYEIERLNGERLDTGHPGTASMVLKTALSCSVAECSSKQKTQSSSSTPSSSWNSSQEIQCLDDPRSLRSRPKVPKTPPESRKMPFRIQNLAAVLRGAGMDFSSSTFTPQRHTRRCNHRSDSTVVYLCVLGQPISER